MDSPGSSRRSQNRILGGVDRMHWPRSPGRDKTSRERCPWPDPEGAWAEGGTHCARGQPCLTLTGRNGEEKGPRRKYLTSCSDHETFPEQLDRQPSRFAGS